MSTWRERCERRRGAAVVLAAGLAAVALAALFGALAMAAPLGFLHVRFNLSQTPTLVSGPPDLAVSPDGDWVALAWTEEYTVGAGYDKGRGHVYLRAASETGEGWRSKVRVFTGTFGACASDVAVAITGTTAHVAYVVFNDSCNNPSQVVLRYRTCSLTDGRCAAPEAGDPEISLDAREHSITWVDLALDAEGNPHLVWSQFFKARDENKVFFKASDGTTWGGAEYVESNVNSRKPAIAWADGYVHVVWEEETAGSTRIRYQRRTESGPHVGWKPVADILGAQWADHSPRNPDVAARAGKVFVVWDWCSDVNFRTGSCLRYNLVYRRSNDSGGTWDLPENRTGEVGTDLPYDELEGLTQYKSTDNLAQRDESLVDLQPGIALNRAGWPAVVWHVDRNNGDEEPAYDIYYTYALTGTGDSVGWITPTVLGAGRGALGSAVIGVGEPEPGGEQHLHIGYVRKPDTGTWDVYYDSNEEDRYEHVYLPVMMRDY
jgi:hypothetical protein